jgi:hypothetical protein
MDPRTERMLAERRAAPPAAGPPPAGVGRLRAALTAALPTRWRVVSAAGVMLAVGSFAGHYLLVTLPAREQERQLAVLRETGRQQGMDDLARGEGLETCLAEAQAAYATGWDASCRTLRRRAGCPLPSEQAQSHETQLRQAREACVKQLSLR